MIDNKYLERLSIAISSFIAKFGGNDVIETKDSLICESMLVSFNEDTASLLSNFADHTEFFRIILDYQIHTGGGKLIIDKSGKLRVEELWAEDKSLTYAPIDAASLKQVDKLGRRLSTETTSLQIAKFLQLLHTLKQAGTHVELKLSIDFDKRDIVSHLNLPNTHSYFLFVFQSKAYDLLKKSTFPQLSQFIGKNAGDSLVFLIADFSDLLIGKNLIVSGIEKWGEALTFVQGRADSPDIFHALFDFRGNEVQSEIYLGVLNPYYFLLDSQKTPDSLLIREFTFLCNALSVVYLANKVYLKENTLTCAFIGKRLIEVPIEREILDANKDIYKLFEWAYENYSSDKLSLARQLIGIELSSYNGNYLQRLSTRAKDILQIAKINFDLYLRENVGVYFENRLKVLELLNRFLNTIGEEITSITSELVENSYKIAGGFLALFAAYLIKPDLNPIIISLTCYGIVGYLLLLLVFVLPSVFIRYSANAANYDNSLKKFVDILTEDEIKDLRGPLFRKSLWSFRFFFGLTNLVYVLFALLLLIIAGQVVS